MSDEASLSDDLDRLLSPDFFKSLSDPVRLQVVRRLLCTTRPMTVTEVQGCCGVHLSGTSRHLSALRTQEVVEARKSGREVRYSLRASALAARLRALADAIEASAEAARTACGPQRDGCCPRPEPGASDPPDSCSQSE